MPNINKEGAKGEDEEFVLLSVRGALFRLRKETLQSTDWILSKILTSELPWEKVGGQYYVDVDPDSFQLILSILSGVMDLAQEGLKLSGTELLLLKVSAQYLLLDDIASVAGDIKAGYDKIISEQEVELITLRSKVKEMEETASFLEKLPAKLVECRAYRTHRPHNICACASVLLGELEIDDGEIWCRLCNNQKVETTWEARGGLDLDTLARCDLDDLARKLKQR